MRFLRKKPRLVEVLETLKRQRGSHENKQTRFHEKQKQDRVNRGPDMHRQSVQFPGHGCAGRPVHSSHTYPVVYMQTLSSPFMSPVHTHHAVSLTRVLGSGCIRSIARKLHSVVHESGRSFLLCGSAGTSGVTSALLAGCRAASPICLVRLAFVVF